MSKQKSTVDFGNTRYEIVNQEAYDNFCRKFYVAIQMNQDEDSLSNFVSRKHIEFGLKPIGKKGK